MGSVQRVEHAEQLIGGQLRGTTAERQRIQTHWPLRVERINEHHVANPLRRDALQGRLDQVAFGLDHHHGPARRQCLA